MTFALLYDVVENFVERRTPFRPAHLALVRAAHERGELLFGGALAEPVDGALIVFRGDDPALARRFAESDPYVTGGLVTRWRVRRWDVVVGGEGLR